MKANRCFLHENSIFLSVSFQKSSVQFLLARQTFHVQYKSPASLGRGFGSLPDRENIYSSSHWIKITSILHFNRLR